MLVNMHVEDLVDDDVLFGFELVGRELELIGGDIFDVEGLDDGLILDQQRSVCVFEREC